MSENQSNETNWLCPKSAGDLIIVGEHSMPAGTTEEEQLLPGNHQEASLNVAIKLDTSPLPLSGTQRRELAAIVAFGL